MPPVASHPTGSGGGRQPSPPGSDRRPVIGGPEGQALGAGLPQAGFHGGLGADVAASGQSGDLKRVTGQAAGLAAVLSQQQHGLSFPAAHGAAVGHDGAGQILLVVADRGGHGLVPLVDWISVARIGAGCEPCPVGLQTGVPVSVAQ